MLIEFFAISAIGFYAALVAISLVLTTLLENDHPGFSGICLVGLFWYLAWVKIFDVLAYAKGNPVGLILWTLAYFSIGTVSLYPKWYGYVSDELEDQVQKIKAYAGLSDKLVAPQPGDHKEQIIAWAIYWPWSMLWFVVRHPLRRIGRAIYDGMETSLIHVSESMTTRAKSKLEARLKKAVNH